MAIVEHLDFRGIKIPVYHRSKYYSEISSYLLHLDGPPIRRSTKRKSFLTHNVTFIQSGITRIVSTKVASYALEIKGKWYIPRGDYGKRHCHISVLLAEYSKLGCAL